MEHQQQGQSHKANNSEQRIAQLEYTIMNMTTQMAQLMIMLQAQATDVTNSSPLLEVPLGSTRHSGVPNTT